MKLYRIAQDLSDIDVELLDMARETNSVEEFNSAYSVFKNLSKNNIPINSDGTVTLYHATSSDRLNKIKEEGVIKGGSTATGGMTGLQLDPSAFFSWNKEWVRRVWGRGSNSVLEIRVPYRYIRQPAQNNLEVYFEGGLKKQNGDIWVPIQKPRDTFYNRIPSKDYDHENHPYTLEYIWNQVHNIQSL